jgi:uncharacterized membrane protein
MQEVLVITAFIVVPYAILKLVKLSKVLRALGDVVICYGLGILAVNWIKIPNVHELARQVAQMAIPLAIPFYLYGTSLRSLWKLAPNFFISMLLSTLSVILSSIVLGLVFKSLDANSYIFASLLSATYVGGTVNMASLSQILSVNSSTYLMTNSADVITGGTYLLLILTVLPNLYAKFLRKDDVAAQVKMEISQHFSIKQIILFIFATLAIVGISLLFSQIATGVGQMIIFFSFLGFLPMLTRNIPNFPKGSPFEIGHYFLLIFCLAIGAQFHIGDGSTFSIIPLAMAALIILSTAGLHLLMARYLGLSKDEFLFAHMASIYGPPFIPSLVEKTKRRDLQGVGIMLGILGFALGNYVGLLVYFIVQ